MKRHMMIAALMAIALVEAYAQSSTVTLQNQEEATFYYLVDPQELLGLSAGSPLLSTKVAAFFAESKSDPAFSSLGPNAEVQLQNLADGTHLLVGVFAPEGETDLPVRVIAVEADSRAGDRFYALFATPAQLTVTRGMGRLASLATAAPATQVAATNATTAAATTQTAAATTTSTTSTATSGTTGTTGTTTPAAATTATQSTATTASTVATSAATQTAVAATTPAPQPPKLGQIASFASYDPVTFTKEKQGDFTVLPIADSRGWKLSGTRIAGLSGVLDATGLHLALSVPGGFSESVSYFFYVFASRAAGQTNALTLELLPRAEGSRGACLLWKKGSNGPRLIGSVQSKPTSVELDIGADEISSALGGAVTDALSLDVTSGWYDHALGTWEEYYYTTISANQIPAIR
jgi:hypothetical protein